MKKISISLYATLRQKQRDLADHGLITTNAVTVGELLDEIKITKSEAAIVFVNEKRASLLSAIQNEDKIKIFPMLGGG